MYEKVINITRKNDKYIKLKNLMGLINIIILTKWTFNNDDIITYQ